MSGRMAVKRRGALAISFACVAAAIVLTLLPWVTVPSGENFIGGEGREGFSVFGLLKLAESGRAAESIAGTASLESRSPFMIAGAAAAVALLILFAVMSAASKRRAPFFGFAGFVGAIVLPMLYMNMIYDANSESAYAGPGLFAAKFLTITPPVYLLLFVAIFGVVVAVPNVADYLKLLYDPSEDVELRKTLVPLGDRFKQHLKELVPSLVRDRYLYIMLAPFLAYYIIFYYLPYGGLRIAFMDYKPLLGYAGSKYVGLRNFIEFFTGPYFWRILRNTLLLNIYDLLWGFPVPIILAVFFNELRSKRFRTIAQSISYIPNFISTVVIVGMVINFLSPSYGVINFILLKFRLIEEPIYFISKNAYFRTIYVAQGIWAWSGFSSIIYYSSICSIDSELYEAAKIDGANRLKQITRIMLPCLMPTIAIMLIMAVGSLMNSATETIILLYRPVTYEVADVIGSYVYRLGVTQANPTYSSATAVGLFNGIIALILVTSANKVSKKIGEVSIF